MKYLMSWYLSRSAVLTKMAPPHFVVRLPGGTRACIRPNGRDLGILTEIFDDGVYQSDKVPRRVLDLGANIGMATVFLASQFPNAQFACVEPFPGNQAMLRENIRLNNIKAEVFEGAIGTDSGEADLFLGMGEDVFSLTPVDPAGLQKLRVRQFSVPQVLDQLGWESIDLLKIDIEGYEKVLFHTKNDWLRRVKHIVGEAHGANGYGIKEVRSDLEPLGFEVIEKKFDAEYDVTIFEALNRSLA